jgi:hypothetical protein
MRCVVLAILVAVLVVVAAQTARCGSAAIHSVGLPGSVCLGTGAACGGVAKDIVKPPVCDACTKLGYRVYRWHYYVSRALRLWHRRYHLPQRASDTYHALVLMCRESRGYPLAVNVYTKAAGLFQWLPPWWRHRGPGGRDYPIFDPRWNIGMMAQYHASHEAIGRDPWAPWR